MTTIADDSKEQALTLLCGGEDPWTWGGDAASCYFTFERGGTGTISCGENQRDWFAIETEWSLTTDPIRVNSNTREFSIQLTFTTRIAPWYHDRNPWLKGAALEEHLKNPPPASQAPFPWLPLQSVAFRPKTYSFTLSRGSFVQPFQYFIKVPYPLFQVKNYGTNRFAPYRYRSQISFKTSPYPPREEWDESWPNRVALCMSLDFHRHWEKKNYVRESIATKDETWMDAFDLRWWLSPTLGDAYKRGRTL
ncbi:hypothetical protein C7974DRAFT_427139 [Boeremia exigua]|uniref:uncharacterized protein n=1 Tax=Boeremia exigua TaxID=749465 RepID=UPI001E8E9F08|nr:uncharacterized protein C7974DRAFT_427139 [Boeremia exigua]KAH6618914.1 hypothetical protein C7974DRAFT_427139 [Boeremia exigua]